MMGRRPSSMPFLSATDSHVPGMLVVLGRVISGAGFMLEEPTTT